MTLLYRGSPSSYFAYKLRDKATVRLEDNTTIKRNIYTHYVSNNNPVYCRHKGILLYLGCENYQTDNEVFTVTVRGNIKH